MYENGQKINRHKNLIKHKKRLKSIFDSNIASNTMLTDLYCYCNIDCHWWKSIYDGWQYCNKLLKKTNSRRKRRYFNNEIKKYLSEENYDVPNITFKKKDHYYFAM